MIGLTNLASLRVDAKAASAITGHTRRAHVTRATADGVERLRDPPRDELVVARRLRTLASLDLPLAQIAGITPSLLPRQQLSEHVRAATRPRHALVPLTTMTGLSVRAVQLYPGSRCSARGHFNLVALTLGIHRELQLSRTG